MLQLNQVRPEDFEPLLGRALKVEVPGGAVTCELAQVRRLPPHESRRHPPFAVILRGPPDRPFCQGIHPLLHPEHGRLEVFMVPVGPDGAGLCYEVTFN
jgi:hypothetical protein